MRHRRIESSSEILPLSLSLSHTHQYQHQSVSCWEKVNLSADLKEEADWEMSGT